jgi:hypothetical protein
LSDRAGAVRAVAIRDLPDDPPLFAKLATGDESAEVRFYAVARLTDPALLVRICRDDASPWVRMTAMKRLSDPVELAKLARTHRDWVMRKAAVERLTDIGVLSAIASTDADLDVRRAAFLLLDEKAVAAIARSAAPSQIKVEAVSFLHDQRLLEDLALGRGDREARLKAVAALTDPAAVRRVLDGSADPEVRAAAVERAAGATTPAADPRIVTVRRMILDPAITGRLGSLDCDARIRQDEKRYAKDDETASAPPTKGKVLVEYVTLSIRKGDQILFRSTYRGHKSRKAEAFGADSPVSGGYLVKVNAAELDYVDIATALLDCPEYGDLAVAVGSKNKYIHAAAIALSDTWRGTGAAKFESEHDEAIDDD